MISLHPYLYFTGNTEEAFNFYKSVFGRKFAYFHRFGDAPESEEIPKTDPDKILYINLPVSRTSQLMGNDAMESMGYNITPGNNFGIFIEAESREEVEHLFTGLSDGGRVIMPLTDTYWDAYTGILVDKFGIRWIVSYIDNKLK